MSSSLPGKINKLMISDETFNESIYKIQNSFVADQDIYFQLLIATISNLRDYNSNLICDLPGIICQRYALANNAGKSHIRLLY